MNFIEHFESLILDLDLQEVKGVIIIVKVAGVVVAEVPDVLIVALGATLGIPVDVHGVANVDRVVSLCRVFPLFCLLYLVQLLGQNVVLAASVGK